MTTAASSTVVDPLLIVGCGTYDGSTLALSYDPSSSTPGKDQKLSCWFVDTEAHTSSVRSVAVTGQWLVSGASDEYIQVYSVRHRKKVGALDIHSGTVTQLAFHTDSRHLVSASQDASLCVWRHQDRTWEPVRRLSRHKGGVTTCALHPSGRLALSAGMDKTMRVWNLLRGRQAYVTRLKEAPSQLVFSQTGERFLQVFDTRIEVFHIGTPRLEAALQLHQSINQATFLDSEHFLLAIGSTLTVYRILAKMAAAPLLTITQATTSDGGRAKLVQFVPAEDSTDNEGLLVIVSTTAGSSRVEGYRLLLPVAKDAAILDNANRVFSYEQEGVRITCMSACWNTQHQNQQLQETEVGEVEDGEDSEASVAMDTDEESDITGSEEGETGSEEGDSENIEEEDSEGIGEDSEDIGETDSEGIGEEDSEDMEEVGSADSSSDG